MKRGMTPNAPHGTATNSDHPCHPITASSRMQPPLTDTHDTKAARVWLTIGGSPGTTGTGRSRRPRAERERRGTSGLRGTGKPEAPWGSGDASAAPRGLRFAGAAQSGRPPALPLLARPAGSTRSGGTGRAADGEPDARGVRVVGVGERRLHPARRGDGMARVVAVRCGAVGGVRRHAPLHAALERGLLVAGRFRPPGSAGC